ncbi:glycosyltransferase family 2 protein [Novipirellula sp. SH528]|uniref:glycosyltransferase family 2 protein n=1 Tax=Novipirellula sp. SH528 TaxID=3454466 RepID=UPI003FA1396C
MTKPDISIVICTHKRPDMLKDALSSLIRQETDGEFTYEVVVVYSACPIDPELIAEFQQQTDAPLRAVMESRAGQVTARNLGLDEAQGEWIANFDDDQIAEPYWLKELWKTAQEHQCECVGGALQLRFPDGCDRKLTPKMQRMLGATVPWDTVRPYTDQQGPGSGNQMLHRSVFDKLGKYDESFTLRGYDTDMYRRIRMAGFKSWFNPRALGYHVTPSSRLQDEYFKETSLHNGWSFSRRDQMERGTFKNLSIAAARAAQSALLVWPGLILSRMTGASSDNIDRPIQLWRNEGYIRFALYDFAPKLFPQTRFFDKYEFRPEFRMAKQAKASVAADPVAT